MNEKQQIKFIKWIENHTIRVDVAELGLKGVYGIVDVSKFIDELTLFLEKK